MANTTETRSTRKASELALKWAGQETRSAEERVAYATAHRYLTVLTVEEFLVSSDRRERAARMRDEVIDDGAHTIAALLGDSVTRGRRLVLEAIDRATGVR